MGRPHREAHSTVRRGPGKGTGACIRPAAGSRGLRAAVPRRAKYPARFLKKLRLTPGGSAAAGTEPFSPLAVARCRARRHAAGNRTPPHASVAARPVPATRDSRRRVPRASIRPLPRAQHPGGVAALSRCVPAAGAVHPIGSGGSPSTSARLVRVGTSAPNGAGTLARIIATMPARTGSGNVGHAVTTAINSGEFSIAIRQCAHQSQTAVSVTPSVCGPSVDASTALKAAGPTRSPDTPTAAALDFGNRRCDGARPQGRRASRGGSAKRVVWGAWHADRIPSIPLLRGDS